MTLILTGRLYQIDNLCRFESMRVKNMYKIADAFRDSEMLRKLLSVLPQETVKILFEVAV